jgi:hypothetical protein
LFGIGVSRVEAFALHAGCPVDAVISYKFINGTADWTAARKAQFDTGATHWDDIQNADGNAITSAFEDPQFGLASIVLNSEGTASANCTGDADTITLRDDVTALQFKGLSHHEVGHAHGLAHSGRYDSFDSDEPTMSGCGISSWEIMNTREQDDAANLVAHFDDEDLHAIPSFENTGTWTDDIWGTANGAQLEIKNSAGSPRGNQHAEVGPGGDLYQTVRVTDPEAMKAGLWYRKGTSSAETGSILLQIRARRMNYDVLSTGDSCYKDFVHHWDLTNIGSNPYPDGMSFVVYKQITLSPLATWQYDETTTWTLVDGWEGVDVRVWVYNGLTDQGSPGKLDVDWVRVRELP